MIQLFNGDCLEVMKDLDDGSVDLILADIPYGTTACKWDVVIPFESMWEQLHRLIRPDGAMVFTAREPFTSKLVMSNIQNYKHKWVWNKKQSGSFQNAKYMPLQIEEDVLVFAKSKVRYFPIMRKGVFRKKGGSSKKNELFTGLKTEHCTYNDDYYPTNILEIVNPRIGKVHPTQKPVELMEYLIKTYSLENETVLDFTMGSGTTGVACKNLNRSFIGIELDQTYFEIAKQRLESTNPPSELSS
jgi:site-specific DNA-methyltransferase (adenine-specific)